MNIPRLIQLTSIVELRPWAAAWDDLWLRSDVAAPTARAELVAQWIERFAPRANVCILAVEHDGRLLAALPLVGRRLKGLVELAGLPANCWSAAGELLLAANPGDDHGDTRGEDLLAEGIAMLPWPLLWLEDMNAESAGWARLLAALDRAGVAHEFREDHRVGLVDIGDDWPAYEAGRSKNHRKNMRKSSERLHAAGSARFEVVTGCEPAQVEPLLRRAFAVEDRGWKGLAGSSVLRSPGIFEFFAAQARQLAAWGQLEVSFLEFDGQPIAFEYGYRAKGVYFSHKVGYDERFAEYGPGQLLMQELLRRHHGEPAIRRLDCLGPLSDAVGRWTTRTYPSGRLIVTPRRVWSRALLGTYHVAQPLARCVRSGLADS